MSTRGLLHNSDYLKLLSGQTISAIGSTMSGFVFTLLGLAITGSPAQAGLVGTAAALGGSLMSLPGGALADRVSRRTLMVGFSLVGCLLFSSVAIAGLLDVLTLPHLIAVSFLSGAGHALFWPAEAGAMRQIVAPEHLGTALAAAHGRQSVAQLLGAPVGGLLYSIGRMVPVVVDAVSYLVMTVLLLSIKHPLPAAKPDGDAHEPMLRAIRTGLAWLLKDSALRAIAVVGTLLNFAVGGIIIVLILSMQQRGVPSAVIGLMETGMGLGGLLGAVAAPKLLARFSVGKISLAGAWIVCVTFGATAFIHQTVVLIALPSAAMFLLPALNSGLTGYQMLITPDNLQGRAQSALGFLANSISPLAPALGGVLLGAYGARTALLVFGGVMVVGALLLTASRAIRNLPLLSTVSNAQMGA